MTSGKESCDLRAVNCRLWKPKCFRSNMGSLSQSLRLVTVASLPELGRSSRGPLEVWQCKTLA
jgi:hypothetical protein